MKLTIDRDILAPALTALARIVAARNTIPIIGNVALEAEGETLAATATDLDMEMRITVPARVSEPGTTTLPARMIHDIVGKLPAGAEIEIETLADAATVRVRSGRA